jgi:bis(5'-nucleosyl)-tetraphosphatase (symmetrical)
LENLLEHIGLRVGGDRIWFVGDLVNRGPHSLETLRFVRNLGDCAVTVLGNHDLHLLALAEGVVPARPKDTLDEVLAAHDRAELLDWLRHRPLMHVEDGYVLVHAGIPPAWDLAMAQERARELESMIRGPSFSDFLGNMYGNDPLVWSDDLLGWDRLRYITNGFTRMRYCRMDGSLEMLSKGPPGSQDSALLPWFELPERRTRGEAIIIGHWGTLQLAGTPSARWNIHHLETGCAFGATLTAMRLEDRKLFSVPCPDTGRRSAWRSKIPYAEVD